MLPRDCIACLWAVLSFRPSGEITSAAHFIISPHPQPFSRRRRELLCEWDLPNSYRDSSRWLNTFEKVLIHIRRINVIKNPSVQNRCRKLRRTGAVATRSWQGGFCLIRQKIPKRGRRFFSASDDRRERNAPVVLCENASRISNGKENEQNMDLKINFYSHSFLFCIAQKRNNPDSYRD